MAASSETPEEPTSLLPKKPLFSSDPIQYIRLVSGEVDQHNFIVDRDALTRFSVTVKDLLVINDEMSSQNTGLSDDLPACSSSTSLPSLPYNSAPIEFREIPKQALETCIEFTYWKKRWANVVEDRIPDFPAPTEKNLALNVLVAANELRC